VKNDVEELVRNFKEIGMPTAGFPFWSRTKTVKDVACVVKALAGGFTNEAVNTGAAAVMLWALDQNRP
jgi:hypothetical protein